MKVLITGAAGFLGRNLCQHLAEREDIDIVPFTRTDSVEALDEKLDGVDFVFHLAGVNRSTNPAEFASGNADLTVKLSEALCRVAARTGRAVPVVFTSSIHVERDDAYGKSKQDAETALQAAAQQGIPVFIFRLPNVFGKWSRPNYNSAVATFCHNIARKLPVQINDPAAPVTLVYIDDVVESLLRIMDGSAPESATATFGHVLPMYRTTVGELVRQIEAFRDSRQTLISEQVGTGFVRALYSTYVSYLPTESFSYAVAQYGDERGVFVEMLKTPNCGQFSFFTAHPGVRRGGHYHHSKTEKFLVIKGQALFKFRHMQTNETHELRTSGEKPEIVETVPGWSHDITNVGIDELVVMLWANEIFDRARPDTFVCPL